MRGWTRRTYGLVPMTLMGAKSFTGSYAVFVVTGRIAICDGLPISSICPSADERATASAASAPTAAGRFSTTNCCPNASPSGCAIRRAMPSLLPPGEWNEDLDRLLRPNLRAGGLTQTHNGKHGQCRHKHASRVHDRVERFCQCQVR